MSDKTKEGKRAKGIGKAKQKSVMPSTRRRRYSANRNSEQDLVANKECMVNNATGENVSRDNATQNLSESSSGVHRIILKEKRSKNNNNVQTSIREVEPLALSISSDDKRSSVVTDHPITVTDLETTVRAGSGRFSDGKTGDSEQIMDEADSILVDVNADEDEFPSEEEYDSEEDETLQVEKVVTPIFDNVGATPPSNTMSTEIGEGNHADKDAFGTTEDDKVSVYCDSEVNFRLPKSKVNDYNSGLGISAAEMVKQMQKDNPGFMLLMQHLVDKHIEECSNEGNSVEKIDRTPSKGAENPGVVKTTKNTNGVKGREPMHTPKLVTAMGENEIVNLPLILQFTLLV